MFENTGILWPIILFVVGLVLLIFGGDWFVDGATGLAKKFHIPELIIGATVVSIGTTLPEVMVSAGAAVKGSSSIAYGNAIGSVICNTALISALTIAIKPTDVPRATFIKPVFFFFGAAIFYAVISYTTGFFARWVGVVLLAGFVVYMITLVLHAKKEMKAENVSLKSVAAKKAEKVETIEVTESVMVSESGEVVDTMEVAEEVEKDTPLWKDILLLVIGAAAIAFGADFLVDNGTIIAEGLGVPESVIALTFVALGTSLPELVTAITSLVKGHSSLSLGNIVGANLFNLVLVSGLAITLTPFHIPMEKTIAGMNASLVVDIPLMFLVMIIMTVPTLIRQKLSRWQGILLLVLYAAYCVFQFT